MDLISVTGRHFKVVLFDGGSHMIPLEVYQLVYKGRKDRRAFGFPQTGFPYIALVILEFLMFLRLAPNSEVGLPRTPPVLLGLNVCALTPAFSHGREPMPLRVSA